MKNNSKIMISIKKTIHDLKEYIVLGWKLKIIKLMSKMVKWI